MGADPGEPEPSIESGDLEKSSDATTPSGPHAALEIAIDDELDDVAPPDLPPGRMLDLADRGTILVRDVGPADADTTIFLLHGWTATADLNWFRCYEQLSQHYRVVAFDHRGHGSGLRSKKRFRLEDCADDAIAVADALEIDRFIPVGYSMGGPIAQLIWRRHAQRVSGMVLCATAPIFNVERAERLGFLGGSALAALARITPEHARAWLTDQLYLQRKSREWEPWAIREASSHDWRMLLEAGAAIGTFDSTGWIGDVDVPVSLVVTMNDPVVSRRRQTMLFEAIADADVYRVEGDHGAVVEEAERFVPSLLRALASVTSRQPVLHSTALPLSSDAS